MRELGDPATRDGLDSIRQYVGRERRAGGSQCLLDVAERLLAEVERAQRDGGNLVRLQIEARDLGLGSGGRQYALTAASTFAGEPSPDTAGHVLLGLLAWFDHSGYCASDLVEAALLALAERRARGRWQLIDGQYRLATDEATS